MFINQKLINMKVLLINDLAITNEQDQGKYRSIFNRDRDRIIYSRDFLRLGGKTQVFVVGFDDHMRNRLSHTLEVVQISNRIAKNLGLNQDLTEAIAYGHDIGHTPFGHAGERVLNKVMNGCYKLNDISTTINKSNSGFKHNWQGIRVARDLNARYDGKKGLELSRFTEWGILKHTKLNFSQCDRIIGDVLCGNNFNLEIKCRCNDGFAMEFYNKLYPDIDSLKNFSFEALVVKRADDIAQRHHDIEDGLVANLINIEEIIRRLPDKKLPVYNKLYDEEVGLIETLKDPFIEKGRKIKTMTYLIHAIYSRDLITNTILRFKDFVIKNNINQKSEFESKLNSGKFKEDELFEIIDFSKDLYSFDNELQKYLKTSILNSMMAQSMDSKAEYIILKLMSAYLRFPQYLPEKTLTDILIRINQAHPKILLKADFENVREYISNKHFTKLHKDTYINYFLRGICDFIAGMTDDFAYKHFDLIYGTNKVSNKLL